MKIILSLLLLIQYSPGIAQHIKELKSDDEVFAFVNNVFTNTRSKNSADSTYKSILKPSPPGAIQQYFKCANIPLSWNMKQWEKVDFNNDGFTDLFIIANEAVQYHNPHPFFTPFVIININDTGYITAALNLIIPCEFYYPLKIGKQQLLVYQKIKTHFFYDSLSRVYERRDLTNFDTLIYKFNHFIEYNSDSIFPAIQSISFSHSSCWLPCPEYKITIDKSKNITLEGYANTAYHGHYRSIIAEEKFREIFDLLTYVNPMKMKDRYGETGTDSPTAYLGITFVDGTIKQIEGAGWGGTNALNMIYDYFEKIYQHQRWYK